MAVAYQLISKRINLSQRKIPNAGRKKMSNRNLYRKPWDSMEPIISIILACYNGEKFISETIESVLNQNYSKLELIVIDDGSIDNTELIIQEYLSDSRLVFMKHKRNRGIGAARNTGIRLAKGDYICFLDQDDVWLSDRLSTQVETFKIGSKNLGLIYSDYYEIDKEGHILRKVKARSDVLCKSRKNIVSQLFIRDFIPTWTAMVKKQTFERVGLLDERLSGPDDHEFWLRVAGVFELAHIEKPLVKKRMHTDARSRRCHEVFTHKLVAMEDTIIRYPYLQAIRHKRFSTIYFKRGLCLLESGTAKSIARTHLLSSLQYNPLNWRAYLLVLFSFCCLHPQIFFVLRQIESLLFKSYGRVSLTHKKR